MAAAARGSSVAAAVEAAVKAAEVRAATLRLKELECPVCMVQQEDLTHPPCQHLCCVSCMRQLAKTATAAGSPTRCPICRAEIAPATMAALAVDASLRDEVRRLMLFVHPALRLAKRLQQALDTGSLADVCDAASDI